MVTKFSIALLAAIGLAASATAKDIKLLAPNGRIKVVVSSDDGIKWAVSANGKQVLKPSRIGYLLDSGKKIGCQLGKYKTVSKKGVLESPFYKKASVDDSYNEVSISCDKNISIIFRAYNDGVAYRISGKRTPEMTITSDLSEFIFPDNQKAYIPYINDNRGGDPFMYSFESYYDYHKLSNMYADSLAVTPLLVELEDNHKALIIDTDIENFAGMFLKKGEKPNSLVPVYAPCVLEGKIGGFNNLNYMPTKRAEYIAKVSGDWKLPWKGIAISGCDKDMITSDLMYKLSSPCRVADISWIKPGKTTWEWWNNCNLTGVDFKRGINNNTYKYHIDFASKNDIDYVLIDEGWSSDTTLMNTANAIDIKMLADYARQKNVGLLLWASWKNTIKDMDKAFPYYASLGIKGFKIDFFDSDDNRMVRDMYKIAEEAAKHHLVLDYHGMKANGMQRTYPNILSFEGVKGLENNRWVSHPEVPAYECMLPFIRMQAGPMDYTPGGMRNATLSNFRPCDSHPMTYGTRAHQVALYTIFDSPLQILADSPSMYEKEYDTFSFIKEIPTTFDETVVIDAKIGEYVVLARRAGEKWYLAGITNWKSREMKLDLSFLGDMVYKADIFKDGINADFEATDYTRTTEYVTPSKGYDIKLEPGGGWSAILTPQKNYSYQIIH